MKECSCLKCQNACQNKPGWMKPGEAEKIAEFMGMSLDELFTNWLAVDWYETDDEPIFLLAPALKNEFPGTEYPSDPTGECIFFENGTCGIHPVKPFECAEYLHDDEGDVVRNRHQETAQSWVDHQDRIENLLGRKAQAELYGGWDDFINSVFSFFGDDE